MEKVKEEKKVKIILIKPEIYSRVVGYFRPVQNWNIGKKQEFKERKPVKIDKGI
jgi:anaerobic ribonucleoside-triphosphate reductase